jgi:CzcA family heavy metal efflux pump
LRVVWQASNEVRGSIVFATMIVVLVFVPLFALSGIERRLFAPLGVAYIVSILSSLVVSVTVTPALCSVLLPRATASRREHDGLLVRALKRVQRRVLDATLAHPVAVLAGASVLVVVAIGAVPYFGREFLPPFNEGTATLNLMAAPGTSLSTSNTLGRAAETMLVAIPEVRSVGRRTGRAEQDEHAEGVHYTEIDVDFRTAAEMEALHLGLPRARQEVLAEMRRRLGSLPGVVVNVGQPISHRLDHLLSGVRAQVAIKVFGKELGALREVAARVEAAAREVPGMVDLQTEKQVLVPQIRIQVRAEEIARYGFQPGALAATLEAALDGEVVGRMVDADRSVGLWVRVDDATRADVEPIADTLILTPSGARVAIRELAEVTVDRGPNLIQHDHGERRIVVFGNVEGTDLGTAVAALKAKVAALTLPPGMHVSFEGQFQSQESASRLIALLSLLSLGGMVLVLYVHFRSLVLVLQVLVNIPLALVGSVAALGLAGLPMSVATLVGFITLCGIASRNTIMMVDHYIHLMRHEGHAFSRELVVQGSLERLVPVLMTALTAGLGLIPLVVSSDAPGKEILYPVAVVILGGLASSTLLDLLVTPAAFWLFGERASRARTSVASDPLASRTPSHTGLEPGLSP